MIRFLALDFMRISIRATPRQVCKPKLLLQVRKGETSAIPDTGKFLRQITVLAPRLALILPLGRNDFAMRSYTTVR